MPTINKANLKATKPNKGKLDNQHQGRKYYNPNYNTQQWRKLRLELLKANPICQVCEREYSNIADHIHPVRLGGDFWDVKNIQMLCEACHAKKSARERLESTKGN